MAKKDADKDFADPVKKLKIHLETLEKLRILEKDARTRLQKDGLQSMEQSKWAGILERTTKALEAVEKRLQSVLEEVAKVN